MVATFSERQIKGVRTIGLHFLIFSVLQFEEVSSRKITCLVISATVI